MRSAKHPNWLLRKWDPKNHSKGVRFDKGTIEVAYETSAIEEEVYVEHDAEPDALSWLEMGEASIERDQREREREREQREADADTITTATR